MPNIISLLCPYHLLSENKAISILAVNLGNYEIYYYLLSKKFISKA